MTNKEIHEKIGQLVAEQEKLMVEFKTISEESHKKIESLRKELDIEGKAESFKTRGMEISEEISELLKQLGDTDGE